MLGLAGRSRRVAFACAAVCVVVGIGTSAFATTPSASPTTLRAEAARSGRWFGTVLDSHGMSSPAYMQRLRQFSLIEAWSTWADLEPCPGCWNWTRLDQRMAAIAQLGADAKSAALVWGNDYQGTLTPSYLAKMDAVQLKAALKEHIQAVVRRYPQVKVWTVANEPFQPPDATGKVESRRNVFRHTLGPGWIRDALVDAYEANPHATYVAINEFDADAVNAKSNMMFDYFRTRLVDAIPRSHLAVGLQMHLDSCPGARLNPNVWLIGANMLRYSNLGVQVHVTEMDFPMGCAGSTPAQRLQGQARKFHDVAAFCRAISNCRSMSVWGVGDADSWYRWQLHRNEQPLLFDDQYQPKPAYFGVIDGLNRR